MCTIGYCRKLNLLFKNRDKTAPLDEVVAIRPELVGVKAEGAGYYSLGVNEYRCGFVSAAVNTPRWTALAAQGEARAAAAQAKKENAGLTSPTVLLSRAFPAVRSVDDMLAVLRAHRGGFMGYNLLLADRERVVHVELHRRRLHVRRVSGDVVVTNHFRHLSHGPRREGDYPSSFRRLRLARAGLRRVVSLEDLCTLLKTPGRPGRDQGPWRDGVFGTVSSSIVDREARSLYYCSRRDQSYARVVGDNLLKGGEKIFIEMSRYIDLPTYHNIERGHPFYLDMIAEVKRQVRRHHAARPAGAPPLATLEFGAGTGLLSLELAELPCVRLDALEIDRECCEILAAHPAAKRYRVICDDATTYCRRDHYDAVVSTFAHDHIHYDQRFAFTENLFRNLKPGGICVMGGELLPHYANEQERKRSLFRYHNHIIELALRHNRVQLSELENNALKSGLDMLGDYKRHEQMFEEEMAEAGFTLVSKKKLGPLDRHDVGGVFVYVYRKPRARAGRGGEA